jgi:catechol 2,3-dioxygenase-like lactoylglutathione lyase family enzyme
MAHRSASVCTVVRDLDATVAFYRDIMGMGPFDYADVETRDARWNNEPAPGRWRIASVPFGEAEIELIEVLSGRPPHRDFLDRRGEGMNHVCWEMPDGDAYSAQMLKLGLEAGMWPYWGYPEAGFAYVDSEEKAGGVSVEVVRARRGRNHFGLAVDKRDKVIAFYKSAFGISDFESRDFAGRGFLYRGERIDATFRVGFGHLGECRLELVQPISGDTPYARALGNDGEGLLHLRLESADLDDAVARAGACGARPEWSAPDLGRIQLDSRAVGGMTVVLAG